MSSDSVTQREPMAEIALASCVSQWNIRGESTSVAVCPFRAAHLAPAFFGVMCFSRAAIVASSNSSPGVNPCSSLRPGGDAWHGRTCQGVPRQETQQDQPEACTNHSAAAGPATAACTSSHSGEATWTCRGRLSIRMECEGVKAQSGCGLTCLSATSG